MKRIIEVKTTDGTTFVLSNMARGPENGIYHDHLGKPVPNVIPTLKFDKKFGGWDITASCEGGDIHIRGEHVVYYVSQGDM